MHALATNIPRLSLQHILVPASKSRITRLEVREVVATLRRQLTAGQAVAAAATKHQDRQVPDDLRLCKASTNAESKMSTIVRTRSAFHHSDIFQLAAHALCNIKSHQRHRSVHLQRWNDGWVRPKLGAFALKGIRRHPCSVLWHGAVGQRCHRLNGWPC